MNPLRPTFEGQCHYAWRKNTGYGDWTRCLRPKGVNHGERHDDGAGSWVAVWFELDHPEHRWVP